MDALDASRAVAAATAVVRSQGQTVDEAAFWFLSMDRSCQAQLLAMAAGTPQPIPHEDATYTREQTASPIAGWLSFQPLWQEICRTDPDLFD